MKIVLYLHIHQPWRLARFRYLDLGSGRPYFDEPRNLEILRGIAQRCYRPALHRLRDALEAHPDFRFSLSITGTFVEQARAAAPDLLPLLRSIASTGRVALVAESYYHSLSFLLPPPDLADEVRLQRENLEHEFGRPASVLRMTELAYSDDLARFAVAHGYRAMLAEGWEGLLRGGSPNQVYRSVAAPELAVLPRNYPLSDDVGFRFSSKAWNEYPLTSEKYARWLGASPGEMIGLFLDFETLGEHHPASTGILDFLAALPTAVAREPHLEWASVEDVVQLEPRGTVSAPTPVTWADANRDLGAWLGNDLQRSAFAAAKRVGQLIHLHDDPELLTTWRKMLTSDHFYYMYLGGHGADLGVHQYFSAYGNPYDAYANYMNALTDLRRRAVE
ncbi:MAG: glycoside hydrolase family 57 protein [Thermoplasmata archaeon]